MKLSDFLFHEEPGITLYCGDCREVLPLLEEPVDLLLTDPPYGIGFQYADTEYTDRSDGYAAWLWPVIEAAEARTSPSGLVAVFQSAKWAPRWSSWFPRDYRLIAVPKVFVQMNTALVTWATDYVLFWGRAETPRGKQEWQPRPARDWFVSTDTAIPRGYPENGHPCPRPPDMMRYLVSILSPPRSLILDPFAGAGSTLFAAKELGRRAIGIEIEAKYCEITVKRLRQEVLAL